MRISNAPGASSESLLKDTSPIVGLSDLVLSDHVYVCVGVNVLLTGCWGVGCLWSKGGHGHLRCLPWWRRISTQTVWLLKTKTSPWAANTAMGQQNPDTVCVVQIQLTHTSLTMPTLYRGIYLYSTLRLPPSSPLLSSIPYWYVVDSVQAEHTETNKPPIKWAGRCLHPGDVWYAACALFVTVFTCVDMEEQLKAKVAILKTT